MAHPGDIKTTNGKIFTMAQSAALARLVFQRFGENLEDATFAWRRLLGNSTTTRQFQELLDYRDEPKLPIVQNLNGLNPDQDRRDELLAPFFEMADAKTAKLFGNAAYDSSDYSGGIRYFTDLTVETLETLVEGGFVSLNEGQNNSPTIGELLNFGRAHRENVTFDGYAVHKNRPDYRLSIDAISFVGPMTSSVQEDWNDELGRHADANEFDPKNPSRRRLWWD